MIIDKNKFFFILLSLYPVLIIAGPLTSLLNTLLIGLIYLIFFFKDDHYKILYKNKTLKILLLIYVYLIFNSFFSLDYKIGIGRNLGFLRLILLFIAINYFFYTTKLSIKIFYIWTIIFIIFITDVYLERFLGSNIFGWGAVEINGIFQPDGSRIMSFFKDEPIAGSFIHGFIFLISGFLFGFLKNKKKGFYIYFFLISFFLISIILTGERSNTAKIIFGIVLFILIVDSIKLKTKILILTILVGSVILLISNSTYLKNRYVGQFYYYFSGEDSKKVEDSTYYQLYRSGFNVFKNSPILGVGNKNYRIESCEDIEKIRKFKYKCTTHPHQIYLEFLAEHGALGTIILLSLIFSLIFKDLKKIIHSKNLIQIGAFIYLLSSFLPLLPSGSFFTDFNMTLFFINLSFMYAINKNTNIFFVEKK
tara:strand:+ start:5470 stop:6732 length:1263 start_codon:yes stop_codon:yes gene_type:complete